jgi:glycosyltransferase involved in cell wall biosynthesis
MVQVEAYMCGTPSVGSDLPGVRQPVLMSGMGELVPAGNAEALAEGIVRVVKNRARYTKPRHEILSTFSLRSTVDAYEQLFVAKKRS